jgi:pyridoxine 5-phosphate synthase
LYTEAFASHFEQNPEEAIEPYQKAAERAVQCGLGINAGHDLNLKNLRYFSQNIQGLLEVSIGHALISDALYFGLENTVQLYKRELRP